VRVNGNENKIKTIQQVIAILVEDEEYEKCAGLRDALEKLETKAELS
jgi:protein-arginine kinase activator protein McsA